MDLFPEDFMEKFEISQEEIEQRVAILKRFKTLLIEQRKKFQEYLKVLEIQENKIEQEDTESLLKHSQLETEIVASIGSLQKVIVPMQKLYNESKIASYNPQEAIPIENIQDDLRNLQSKVLQQNEKNRTLLKEHMSYLKEQIMNFKNPCKNRSSIYASRATSGSRIAFEV